MLDVHKDKSDQLDEGDDEGAEGRSAEVITQETPAGSQDCVEANTAFISAGEFGKIDIKRLSDCRSSYLAKYQPATLPAMTRCWQAIQNWEIQRPPNTWYHRIHNMKLSGLYLT